MLVPATSGPILAGVLVFVVDNIEQLALNGMFRLNPFVFTLIIGSRHGGSDLSSHAVDVTGVHPEHDVAEGGAAACYVGKNVQINF